MRLCTPMFLFSTLLPGVAAAGTVPELTWDAFAAKADGCTIRMLLPDGTRVEGRPVAFRAEAMELNVRKTSNRRAHPKGVLTIPRETVSVVEIRANRKTGRLVGLLVPLGAGAAMVGAGFSQSVEAPMYELLAAGGLTLGVGMPAGFLTGRAIDRRFRQFAIAPPAR